MAIISGGHPVTAEDQRKFWEDELINARILLHDLNAIIDSLLREEKKSFSMDTGQTTINVTRQDVPALIDRRGKLIKEIEDLEEKLSVDQPAKLFQGNPVW